MSERDSHLYLTDIMDSGRAIQQDLPNLLKVVSELRDEAGNR